MTAWAVSIVTPAVARQPFDLEAAARSGVAIPQCSPRYSFSEPFARRLALTKREQQVDDNLTDGRRGPKYPSRVDDERGFVETPEGQDAMQIAQLSPEDYEAVTSASGIVLVDAWASFCGPCRAFAPVFEEASRRHPRHRFAKLDVERHQELGESLGIEFIPTLLVYRDGVLIYREAGSPPAEILDEIVAQAESLNMDDVRARRRTAEKAEDTNTTPSPTDH